MMFRQKKKGISFLEVMFAAVILSSGIVGVYRAFFTSLSAMDHLTYRLYGNNFLYNQINLHHKDYLKADAKTHEYVQRGHVVFIRNKKIDFIYHGKVHALNKNEGLYRLDADVSWTEGSHLKRIKRSIFLFNNKDHEDI